jgi:hypothetical protein
MDFGDGFDDNAEPNPERSERNDDLGLPFKFDMNKGTAVDAARRENYATSGRQVESGRRLHIISHLRALSRGENSLAILQRSRDTEKHTLSLR